MSSENSYNGFANDLQASLPPLLDFGKHSDLIIKCEGDTHTVHKVFMCAHSTWFTKACEAGFEEAKPGEVSLEEEDPTVVKAMVEAIYRGDYSHGKKDVPSASLQFHAMVYALGVKYDVPLLRKLAKAKFGSGCEGAPKTHHLSDAIEELYTSTLSSNRGLRDIAIRTAIRDGKVLWQNLDFNDMVERVGEFGRDMAKTLSIGGRHQFTCPYCENRFSSTKLYSDNLNTCYCPLCEALCTATRT
ncbi:hypothetical protein BLS_004477 [Venturia inaequalis]|uniref:BTB domain-containing protein n=1 Tax=Venturia inaequalis TaxID=5025 RepID=A0A8H3ZGI7_VENIN|nr:hypothetical protein BLS_004477 [Venturia inaequalis]KAE9992502.1 hypothetical protein EG327_008762 [Venturia inaequalis]RDI79568.1 hypothetical protein Vi05172_g10445 [Venturia inaequalis]